MQVQLHPLTWADHPVTWIVIGALVLAVVAAVGTAYSQRAARRRAEDDVRREVEARRHAEALVEEARRLRKQEESLAGPTGAVTNRPANETVEPAAEAARGWSPVSRRDLAG